ncbi:MAG: hypothetical protein K6T75_09090 [Acetobacteraceae bacterium]|nr:hypothetical protein [Acetobacteraceae bacterium]
MAAWWQRQEGMVTVLVGLAVTAILGLGAIALDAGQLYLARGRLQDVADSAALAGAALLPEDPDGAVTMALEYAALNGVPEGQAEVGVEEGGDVVRVTVRSHVGPSFASALGLGGRDLEVSSRGRVASLSRLEGAQPLGVELSGYEYGALYTLKLEAGGDGEGPEQGNFHALALGGRGASNYRDNLAYGYEGCLGLGDQVWTEPGDMRGPTYQGLRDRIDADPDATYLTVEPGSPRLLLVPIVNTFDVEGRKAATIVGFAAFFLEAVSGGASVDVQGRFLHLVVDGPSEDFPVAPDCGLRVVKIVS